MDGREKGVVERSQDCRVQLEKGQRRMSLVCLMLLSNVQMLDDPFGARD